MKQLQNASIVVNPFKHTPKPRTTYLKTKISPLIQLQRIHGNQGLRRLINAKTRFVRQNNVYEQEADRVADHVMGKSDVNPLETPFEKNGIAPALHTDNRVILQRSPEGSDPLETQSGCLRPDNIGNFCQPYGSRAEARQIRECLLRSYIPLLSNVFGSEVGSLWRSYLNRRHGASLRPQLFSSPSSRIVQGFVASRTIHQRQRELLERIKQSLRASCPQLPANQYIEFSVNRFLSPEDLEYPINFSGAVEIPGHIAGGVGSSDAGPDSRRVQGSVFFYRSADDSGRTTGIRIETNFNFVVRDAIDFCLGQPGGEMEQMLTIPLSRLEATGLFLQDEPFAYDVPFEVRFSGTSIAEDLDFPNIRACYPDSASPSVLIPSPEAVPEPEEPKDRFLGGLIRRKASEHSIPVTTLPTFQSNILTADLNTLRGAGRPMDRSTRKFMESRLGWDFRHVRIHNDSHAAFLARSVNARAFTIGHNVIFGKNQYDPGTYKGKRLLAHELAHVVQQSKGRSLEIQRYAIDATCSSSEQFEAEQWGGMMCQNNTMIENGTVLTLNFADLPNRCPNDNYTVHSSELLDRATRHLIGTISSSSRPERCLREQEFQRGILDILSSTSIRCDNNRKGNTTAGIWSNTVNIGHGEINSSAVSDVNYLAAKILHEVLHIWEGRFGSLQHTGIVTPCTAACFPESRQFGVDTNPDHCVMPPLARSSGLSLGLHGEATRGGGSGLVLLYRRQFLNALEGHLSGHAGLNVTYEYLFSDEARRRYGDCLLRLTPLVGISFRPGVLDRTGLVFNFDVGPTFEYGFQENVKGGVEFNLGAGLEFDFLYFGAGLGAIVPLSDDSETILNFMMTTRISF
jgi:hypothetical protein